MVLNGGFLFPHLHLMKQHWEQQKKEVNLPIWSSILH